MTVYTSYSRHSIASGKRLQYSSSENEVASVSEVITSFEVVCESEKVMFSIIMF